MDTVPKFVQLIKWVQAEIGVGSPLVRAPRMELAGEELAAAKKVLSAALKAHPKVDAIKFPNLIEA
jgi:hypothetical protein